MTDEVTLADVLAEVKRIRALPDRWWTYADVAAFLQCSEATARRMLKQPGAPSPCALQTDAGGSSLPARYSPDAIKTWVERSTRVSGPARRRRAGSTPATSLNHGGQ